MLLNTLHEPLTHVIVIIVLATSCAAGLLMGARRWREACWCFVGLAGLEVLLNLVHY